MTNSKIVVASSQGLSDAAYLLDRNVIVKDVGGNDHVYFFYIDNSNSRVGYKKSTDGGATWGSKVDIDSGGGENYVALSCWYQEWTPDGIGGVIHVIGVEDTNDDYDYFGIDTEDSDNTVTNNQTQIGTDTVITDTECNPQIIEATDGDLYASVSRDGNDGVNIYRSGDSGATWDTIYSETEWNIDANDDSDKVWLIPLKTDNDILAIFFDDSGNDLYSIRYDGASTDSTGWDATNTTIESNSYGATSSTSYYNYCSPVCDNNGDVWFIIPEGTSPQIGNQAVQVWFYDESASSWTQKADIYPISPAGGESGDNEKPFTRLAIDQVDGTLFYSFVYGDAFAAGLGCIMASHDGGETWTDVLAVTDDNEDYTGLMMGWLVDSGNNLPVIWHDRDNAEHACVSGGLPLVRKTGNVVDDGGTAVEGADIHGFEVHTSSHFAGYATVKYQGKTTTDASGNYTLVFVDYQNDSPNFFVAGTEGSGASEQTDASRVFSS